MLSISHYDFDLQLTMPEAPLPLAPGSIRVTGSLQIRNDGPEPADRLSLLLYRLQRVTALTVDGAEPAWEQRLTAMAGMERWHVNHVTITLSEPLAPLASCTVAIAYEGPMAGARERWPYIWDQVGREYTLLRLDSLWYPVAAEPVVEQAHQAMTRAFTYDLTVHLPEGQVAVAAGPLDTADQGVARFQAVRPRSRMDVAVAPFTCLRAGSVAIYHLPGFEAWGEATAGWARAALDGMVRRLGDRATDRLAFAQIPEGWGSQHSAELILQQAGDPADWFSAAQVVHEVTHSWTPKPDDWPNRFSDESLAHYFEALLLGDIYGPERTAERLAQYRRAVERMPAAAGIGLLRAGEHPRELGTVTRCRGPLALEALRHLLGDDPFWALLRVYTAAERSSAQAFVALLRERHPGAATEACLAEWFL